MEIPLYQVDAFADALFTGNPAAVCPLEAWLPDIVLQAIASENNLSETAFYVPTGDSYHLRWFTPGGEVRLCGHATLATAFVLFEIHGITAHQIVFNSLSGNLCVRRQGDTLTLDFPAQPASPCAPPPLFLDALGAIPDATFRSEDYMAVFASEEDILRITPNFNLMHQLDLRGVIITAPGLEVDFVSRCFYPKYAVNEDPVTGSAHCTMAPYWSQRLQRSTLTARQLSRRGGNLTCQTAADRVFITGKAMLYLKGSISLPD